MRSDRIFYLYGMCVLRKVYFLTSLDFRYLTRDAVYMSKYQIGDTTPSVSGLCYSYTAEVA